MKEEIIRLKEELKLEIKDRKVLWDYMKMKKRRFSQAFSKRLARDRREKREFLEVSVAIDFEKAFDSVSRSFLYKTLCSLGFGKQFCKWVKILYTTTQSCIFNGGMSTGYFTV